MVEPVNNEEIVIDFSPETENVYWWFKKLEPTNRDSNYNSEQVSNKKISYKTNIHEVNVSLLEEVNKVESSIRIVHDLLLKGNANAVKTEMLEQLALLKRERCILSVNHSDENSNLNIDKEISSLDKSIQLIRTIYFTREYTGDKRTIQKNKCQDSSNQRKKIDVHSTICCNNTDAPKSTELKNNVKPKKECIYSARMLEIRNQVSALSAESKKRTLTEEETKTIRKKLENISSILEQQINSFERRDNPKIVISQIQSILIRMNKSAPITKPTVTQGKQYACDSDHYCIGATINIKKTT